MSFFILCEPDYAASSWCHMTIAGLLEEKRLKRFSVVLLNETNEMEKFPRDEEDVVLLVGTNDNWLDSVIDVCKKRFGKNIIVVGNFEQRLEGKSYSIVSSDISSDVIALCSYLRSYGKSRIALYGINPRSASDQYRKKVFLQNAGTEKDVFLNRADLKACFEAFLPSLPNYDAVLCANDYCAVSFMRNCKEHGIPLPYLASCGESHLAKAVKPTITNLKQNYSLFGHAAVNVYKSLSADNNIASVKTDLVSEISPGDTTDNLPSKGSYFASRDTSPRIQDRKDLFYSDVEILEMLQIENLLANCSQTEFSILQCLLAGMTYAEIGERFFMSTNGIKYKAKKMFELCGTDSKNDFLDRVGKYLPVPPPEELPQKPEE